ncbi:Oidioi.mRNA.OKI2018_I69.chr2.g4872.t1.cds [Oikopleura dioica]|uniref:Oidioi.mRNA.OKI2018_I69.chr2.g4872.t1.cds n=1 Tax=Oikopleura dioica TaxID=34765 RepID=A0ABN7T566_OIKDI|nr:Oidioi.mRNA.OKI2018_I69.chr2.g4872.t1.cds [Oikopleura dioica]
MEIERKLTYILEDDGFDIFQFWPKQSMPANILIDMKMLNVLRKMKSKYSAVLKKLDIDNESVLHHAALNKDSDALNILVVLFPELCSVKNSMNKYPIDLLRPEDQELLQVRTSNALIRGKMNSEQKQRGTNEIAEREQVNAPEEQQNAAEREQDNAPEEQQNAAEREQDNAPEEQQNAAEEEQNAQERRIIAEVRRAEAPETPYFGDDKQIDLDGNQEEINNAALLSAITEVDEDEEENK